MSVQGAGCYLPSLLVSTVVSVVEVEPSPDLEVLVVCVPPEMSFVSVSVLSATMSSFFAY